MRKTFAYLSSVAVVVIAMTACSGYNKIMKSPDYELVYKTGLSYYNQEKYEKAKGLFEQIQPIYVGTLKEDSLTYYLATCHYKQGDFTTSGEMFDTFRRRFGRSTFVEDAEYMYAMGYYFSSPAPEWDQTNTRLAISAITEYLAHYPQSVKKDVCLARVDELQNRLYEQSFMHARTYYKIGNYKSALVAIGNALDLYPQTPYREELLYLNTVSAYELASNSIPSLQTDRYLSMLDYYYSFVSEFPYSEHRKEVDRMQEKAKAYLAKRHIDTDNNEELNTEDDAD